MADTKRELRPATLVPPLSAQGLDQFAHFAIYRLPDGHLDVLGSGGMGTTYRAFDLQLERPVALKTIHPQHLHHPEVRSRFLRESKAAARLQHPNIAGILYQGEENGICFYAMELVSGENLDSYVHRTGPMDPVDALQICHQAALGLDAAFQVHLLHRDLKPANIMLTRYHENRIPHVKVIDFGLAKFIQDMPNTFVTQAGFMGTPGYASPEQCQELAVDCRSDLYSLGSTLWFMLSGRGPFEGSTLAIIQSHVHDEPDYGLLPTGAEPVFQVLRRLLAKKPDDRPPTPAHALYEIECAIQALGGPATPSLPPIEITAPPVFSRPPSPGPKTFPRIRLYLWGGSAVILAFLILCLTIWLMRKPGPVKTGESAPLPAEPPPPSPSISTREPLPSPAATPDASPVPAPSAASSQPAPQAPVEPAAAQQTSLPATAAAPAPATEPAGVSIPEPVPAPVITTAAPAPPASVEKAAPASSGAVPDFSAPLAAGTPETPAPEKAAAAQEKINSLGMRFVPLPFFGGWISAWETRLKDYEAFARDTKRVPPITFISPPAWNNPEKFKQGPDHPVILVSPQDAAEFCRWLTEREKASGLISATQVYRLPTRLEIEAAQGRVPREVLEALIKNSPKQIFPRPLPPAAYLWGDLWPPADSTGNFADESALREGLSKKIISGYKDSFSATAPVGSFAPNTPGIFDLAGNVWEMYTDRPSAAQVSRGGRRVVQLSKGRFLALGFHSRPTGRNLELRGFPLCSRRGKLSPAFSPARTGKQWRQ